jgi:hypothetical protein
MIYIHVYVRFLYKPISSVFLIHMLRRVQPLNLQSNSANWPSILNFTMMHDAAIYEFFSVFNAYSFVFRSSSSIYFAILSIAHRGSDDSAFLYFLQCNVPHVITLIAASPLAFYSIYVPLIIPYTH